MKKINILVGAIILSITFISCNNSKIENQNRFELLKGINISHWLSQVYGFSPRATYITEKDITFLDS